MAVPTTTPAGPRSAELDDLDKAIESHPIWTELRGPLRMKGGLPEYIIPNWMENGSITIDRVSGVNPEF